MGDLRSVRSVAWDTGPVRVAATVAEQEIYDGATPAWTVLTGTVDGWPEEASVSVTATLQDERMATIVTRGRRSISPSGGGR